MKIVDFIDGQNDVDLDKLKFYTVYFRETFIKLCDIKLKFLEIFNFPDWTVKWKDKFKKHCVSLSLLILVFVDIFQLDLNNMNITEAKINVADFTEKVSPLSKILIFTMKCGYFVHTTGSAGKFYLYTQNFFFWLSSNFMVYFHVMLGTHPQPASVL